MVERPASSEASLEFSHIRLSQMCACAFVWVCLHLHIQISSQVPETVKPTNICVYYICVYTVNMYITMHMCIIDIKYEK